MRKLRTVRVVSAGELCFDILYNDLHRPLIEGRANIDKIEDAITIGQLSNELGYISAETVKEAINLVNELIVQYNVR